MEKKEEMINWLKFCKIRGIGSSKMLKLLGIFGSFENLFSASNETLFKTRIFNEDMLLEFKEIKNESQEYEDFIFRICEKENINIIPFFSKDYPTKLKLLPDAPLTLYAIGNLELLGNKKVAIVGSRESDENAREWALNLSKDLSTKNITIVSGGAKGIDYQAHKGALETNGKTICILGTGLLKLYPPEHRGLFEQIKKTGLLLSEHPPNDAGGRLSLLRRNRIISGISNSLVIVTSSTKGGSKTQIQIAHSQRIPIFCPSLSLNLTPNEGIKEAIEKYSAKEVIDSSPIISEIKKEDLYFSIQKTL